MSPKEAVTSPYLTPIVTGCMVVVFSFVLVRVGAASDALSLEMEKKASKEFVLQNIEAAKKEIDAKRDADYREIKANILYIKEGVDELKRK